MLEDFLGGAIAMGFAVAALFFLKFWHRTREKLFLAFSGSFLLLAVTQALLTLSGVPTEERSQLYLLRLMAFLSVAVPLAIYAIFGVVGFLRATDETDARVSRSLRVAHEHASKVMATSEAVAEKAFSLVNGKKPQDLRSIEAFLHEELRKRSVDQPQIQSI